MVNYTCEKCNKYFDKKSNYITHINRKYKCKNDMLDETKKGNEQKQIGSGNVEPTLAEVMKKLIKSNEELVKKVGELELKVIKLENKSTTTINNNTLNLNLVGYGKEDISKIDTKEIIKVLQGFQTPLKLAELTHFNPKYPENQNVYISSMKNKYATYFDGNKWKLTTKEELVDKMYDDKKNYIEENFEDFVQSLSESRKNALRRWLDTNDHDKKITKIKDEMKLMLYNNRPKT